MNPSILALIPARGGSKGLPLKNIRPMLGKPLIAWTIETALSCSIFDRVVVSSDSNDIIDVARQYGAEVPFVRPADLAQDNTPDFPVFEHALSWLEGHASYKPDVVVWLRPTVPLRIADDIESAVNLLVDTDADCVRSVCLVEHHPYWMKRMDDQKLLSLMGQDEQQNYQRQFLPPVYRLNGAVDCVWRARIGKKKPGPSPFWGWAGVYGYVMPVDRSVDVDDEVDLIVAETIMRRRLECRERSG